MVILHFLILQRNGNGLLLWKHNYLFNNTKARESRN